MASRLWFLSMQKMDMCVEGWTKTSQIKAVDFAKELESVGLKTLIYTDIAKDGMLSGPDFEELENLIKSVAIDVIASGGSAVKSMCEIESNE